MNPFKDYFYYNRRERLAVIFLCSFLVVIFVLSLSLYWLVPPASYSNHWDEELMAFQEQQTKVPNKKSYSKKPAYPLYASAQPTYGGASFGSTTRSGKALLEPFAFNPNTISAEELETMGVSPRAIQSWMNYREKGGYFRDKESVSRVYNLSDKEFNQLENYIQFPEKEQYTPTALPPAFDFDPNTSSPEELAQLGLSPKTIKSIVNYRTKGGQFREAADFKKIYTLPEALYHHLSGHIKIVAQPTQKAYATKKAPAYKMLDVNQASSTDFEQFRGIGPSYARRLVEWRERLGGFVEVDQVGELYKLPDSTFQQMRPFLSCAPSPLSKINVNTATLEELKAHPYLRWAHAKAIVQYRERKGAWKSVELLQILPELDDGKGTFERIRPYLRVQ